MRFWQNSLERVITLNAVTWLWRLWGMARRGRRRVIEGNERLPLITPCLLSGVHTCFRNILPAQCITRQSLSVAGNVCFQGYPSSVVGYSRTHTDAHIPPTVTVYSAESFDKAVCRGSTRTYQGTRGHCRSFGARSLYKLSFASTTMMTMLV